MRGAEQGLRPDQERLLARVVQQGRDGPLAASERPGGRGLRHSRCIQPPHLFRHRARSWVGGAGTTTAPAPGDRIAHASSPPGAVGLQDPGRRDWCPWQGSAARQGKIPIKGSVLRRMKVPKTWGYWMPLFLEQKP